MTSGDSSSDQTSLTLLQRVRCGDQSAWQRLSDVYGPLVYHWCRRCGISEDESSDLAQEVFLILLNRLSTFQKHNENHSFRGWLWTVTRNRIRDHLRSEVNRPRATGGTDANLRMAELPASEAEATGSGGETRLIHRALEAIRPEFRVQSWTAFWLTSMNGLSSTEAAHELGIRADAVRKAKSRVLRRLREELAQA